MEAFQWTPGWTDTIIYASDLLPFSDRTSPDFWGVRGRIPNHCGRLAICRERNRRSTLSLRRDDFRSSPPYRNFSAGQIDPRNAVLTIDVFGKQNSVRRFPVEPRR